MNRTFKLGIVFFELEDENGCLFCFAATSEFAAGELTNQGTEIPKKFRSRLCGAKKIVAYEIVSESHVLGKYFRKNVEDAKSFLNSTCADVFLIERYQSPSPDDIIRIKPCEEPMSWFRKFFKQGKKIPQPAGLN